MHIKQNNVLPRFWDNCFHNALLLLLIINLCAAIIAKISHMTQQIVQKGQNWGQGINTKYVPFSKLTGGTCHRRYWMTGMFHLPPPSTHCLGTWPVPMPVLKATSWDVTCSDACAESHLCLYFAYAKPFCSSGIWRTITHTLAVSDILQEKKIYIYGSAFLQKNRFVNGSVVTCWNAYICHWHTKTALNPFWTTVIESNLGNQLVFIENMFILSPLHMCPKPCTSRLRHLVSQLVHAPLQLTWIATLLVGQKWSL